MVSHKHNCQCCSFDLAIVYFACRQWRGSEGYRFFIPSTTSGRIPAMPIRLASQARNSDNSGWQTINTRSLAVSYRTSFLRR